MMVLFWWQNLSYYIFLPSTNIMENPNLHAILTNIHQLINRITPTSSHPRQPHLALFYDQTTAIVAQVKTQVRQALLRLGEDEGEPLTSLEINMFKAIKAKLSLLNRDHNYLFEEGILALYEDFCGLQKSSQESKIRPSIRMLLNEVREALKDLVEHYFLFHQYLQRKQKMEERWLSSERGKNDEKTASDHRLLEEIRREWSGVQVQELLRRQVRKEEDKMKCAVQLCRICFTSVLITHIQQHVKACQKLSHLQQLRQNCHSELQQAKAELKEDYEQILAKDIRTDKEMEFIEIVKVIVYHKEKSKEADRRCSLIQRGTLKQLEDIPQIIEGFMQTYGEQASLTKIVSIYKQKAYLEKQINCVELHTHAHNYHQTHSQHSYKSIKSKVQTKKSQFKVPNRKNSLIQDDKSNSSQPKSESSPQREFDELREKSKKILSRNTIRRNEQAPLCHIKNYSSLQEIMVECDKSTKNICLQSFDILKVLGEGAFGKVYMVRRKETMDIYALKIIKMPASNAENSMQFIRKEHSIFKKIGGEHLVKAPFSFSEHSCHFFVLEYLPGGDLRRLLNQEVYLEQERARAYLAQIVLAIEHLHQFDVIHRDLKPQNLVFDKNGHLKLTDFGLSQFQMKEKLEKSQKESGRKTRRRRQAVLSSNKQKMKLIGTPDYIAPEIVFKISCNNFSIDWWSLGVMAYELMVGTRPFCAETIEDVIDNITKLNIEWPEVGYQQGMISPQAKDLICQLLNKDFMHRLGASGAEQVKRHPFFAKIEWATIKSAKPVVLPKMVSPKNYEKMEEDGGLRRQILDIVKKGGRKMGLQQFVRFDLLGRQTLQRSEMVGARQRKRLKTLKVVQQSWVK